MFSQVVWIWRLMELLPGHRVTRTATSDSDLLVIGDRIFTGQRTSFAASYQFEGELFEVFAHTPAGFEQWGERGLSVFRPVIVDIAGVRHTSAR